MEQYARIKDFPNYAVSNFGNVLNIKKNIILKNQITKNGYYYIKAYNNDIRKLFYIHRLVALHFIDNSNNYEEIDHIDRNKSNNNVCNLRWATRSMNCRNMVKRGCISKIKNSNSWNVEINIRGTAYRKCFTSLDEATKHLQEKLLEFDTDISSNSVTF